MARTSTTDLTAAEVNIVQWLEPLGSALQVVRVNAGATSLEYGTIAWTWDVVWPVSATDNAIVRFDTTTWKLIQNSLNTISDTWLLSINVAGTGTTLTNPNLQATNSVDNFTQISNQNKSATANSSADLIAYPNNNTNDTTGFVDIWVTSSAFAQAAYAITTPNDAYLFGSAVSGAWKLGNLVIATDSTGSSNSIIFWVNWFSALNKERARIDGATGALSLWFSAIASGILKLYNSANAFIATIQNGTMAGNATITLPNASSTLPIFWQQVTFTWPTAARSIALPDANFTVARTDAANTFTGVQTMTSPAITTPAITGLATGSGVDSAATASTLMTRDSNWNANVSILGQGFTTTATAAGTTTLTIAAKYTNVFTGSTTQTVLLPTTTVAQWQQYFIVNNSTGNVTVQSSGANTIQILGAGMNAIFTALVATPTTAANWACALEDSTGVNLATTATANAATINLAYKTNTITNNSAATLTITLPTAGAIDWETRIVRVLDFSAVAQTITWVNTENSSVTAPTTSNGSTTLFLTVGFIYNGATSKWRCISYA